MIFIENSHVRNKHIDEFQNMFLWQLIFGTCFPNEYRKTENHSVADSKSYMALLYAFIVISMVEITLGSYFLIVLALLMFIGKSTNYAEDD